MSPDYLRSVDMGDFRFVLARIAGRVHARRQLLNGSYPDIVQPEESVGPDDLPEKLRGDYYILASGDNPVVA